MERSREKSRRNGGVGAKVSRMSYWAVAQTQPRREAIAIRYLADAGIETYLPRIADRNRIVPLFPCYLFVRIMDRWHPIKNCIGITRVLLSGERPAILSDSVIMEIRARENRNGLVKLPPKYKIGDRVKIVNGAFCHCIGLYDGMTGRQRERVLLEFLGRMVPLELEARDISAV
jgi:transcription antitermination factor NusG